MHNYGTYNGQMIGSAAVPNSAFANLWGQIAGHFESNPGVIFGLMNEPQETSATGWLASVNTAIAAIRATGASQEVLVPGINWDGAWTWTGTPNATVIGTGVVDPLKNYAFEVHQYLDSDGSGTTSEVASAQTGVQRLEAVTQWAEQTGNRLFLGEFGVATDTTSLAALKNMLGYMNQHTGAWQGATYWAGGPWWWGSNIYGIEPNGLGTAAVTDQPQMTILKAFESTATATGTSTSTTSAPAADPGPTLTVAATIGTLEAGQSEVIGTVMPGVAGQGVSLTTTSGGGSVALGSTLSNGAIQVVYTAPAVVGSSVKDTLTYVLTDTPGGAALSATAVVQLDAGPTLVSTVPTLVGVGKTVIIGTVTPGLAGDQLTLTVTGTAPAGTVSLNGTQVLYTAPAQVAAGAADHFAYQVVDQFGAAKATGSGSVTLDPGPVPGPVAITVGHNQTTDLTAALLAAATPGITGDALALSGATASHGTAAATAAGHVTYAAPASGSDTLHYTVSDQLGDTAQGTAAITVDPGPTAGNVTSSVKLGASVDLSATILGAALAGLKGDQLTIQATSSAGTLGAVSRVNGDIVYTAGGTGLASLTAGQTVADKLGFTIADQYGDTASATATMTVSNPATSAPVATAPMAPVAAAPPVTPAPPTTTTTPTPSSTPTPPAVSSPSTVSLTLQGYANQLTLGNSNYTVAAGLGAANLTLGDGSDTVTLAGYSNTIVAGNGADTVTGGGGTTTIKLGNGNDTVRTPGYSNSITVGTGTNTIVAGAGSNTVVAGAGTDQISLDGYGNKVTLNGSTAAVTGGQGSNTIVANGGIASLTVNGWGNHIALNGPVAAAVNDLGHGLKLDIGSITQTDMITGFGGDGSGLVAFKGAGTGFSSVDDILKALHSDGHGGTTLIFGTGSIDFAGTAQSLLHASNFQIG